MSFKVSSWKPLLQTYQLWYVSVRYQDSGEAIKNHKIHLVFIFYLKPRSYSFKFTNESDQTNCVEGEPLKQIMSLGLWKGI